VPLNEYPVGSRPWKRFDAAITYRFVEITDTAVFRYPELTDLAGFLRQAIEFFFDNVVVSKLASDVVSDI
jgi:hypothetical protein